MRLPTKIALAFLILSLSGVLLFKFGAKAKSHDRDFIDGINRLLAQEGLDWRITPDELDEVIEILYEPQNSVVLSMLEANEFVNLNSPLAAELVINFTGNDYISVPRNSTADEVSSGAFRIHTVAHINLLETPGRRTSFERLSGDNAFPISNSEFIELVGRIDGDMSISGSYQIELGQTREGIFLGTDQALECTFGRNIFLYSSNFFGIDPWPDYYTVYPGEIIAADGTQLLAEHQGLAFSMSADGAFNFRRIDGTAQHIMFSTSSDIPIEFIQIAEYCISLFNEQSEPGSELQLPAPR